MSEDVFRREYLLMGPAIDPVVDAARYFAAVYHVETEEYDRRITRYNLVGPGGGVRPGDAHEFALMNRNALAVWKRITVDAARHGVDEARLHVQLRHVARLSIDELKRVVARGVPGG